MADQYEQGASAPAPTNGHEYPPSEASVGPYDQGAKRPRADDVAASPAKRPAPVSPVPGGAPETVYRYLCNASLVGSITGADGGLAELSQRTGAFMQIVHEAPSHCQERVVVVSSPKEPNPGDTYNGAQLAVFELFERQLNIERNPPPGGPFLRMLMDGTQAGSLIGKGGATIKELREMSGVQNIKVLQPEDLPPCALASDKLLHITGTQDALKLVLQLSTNRLRDSPPKDRPSHEPSVNAYPPGSMPVGGSMPQRGGGAPPMAAQVGFRGGPGPGGYMGPPHGGPPPGAYGMGPPPGARGPPYGGPPRGPPMYGGGPPPGGMQPGGMQPGVMPPRY